MKIKYKTSEHLAIIFKDSEVTAINSLTGSELIINENVLYLLGLMRDWINIDSLLEQVPSFNFSKLNTVLINLHDKGLIVSNPNEYYSEELQNWTVIDLLFRKQLENGGYDSTIKLKQRAPKAFKSFKSKMQIKLPKKSNLTLLSKDFFEVLASRRSIRSYKETPISLQMLGLFLDASASVQEIFTHTQFGTMSLRAFPSGGARHPLEIYIIANDITSLEKGCYYYHPVHHTLTLVKPYDNFQEEITSWCTLVTSPSINRSPQCIIIVTAVFYRTLWKYSNIGLATIFKDLGALIQTFYLTAEAINLAPCAIGLTREKELCNWLNLKPLQESPVGIFLLGSK